MRERQKIFLPDVLKKAKKGVLVMRKVVFSILVDNTSGVLSRIAGLFSRRGYNIDSLTVGVTADPRYSRATVVAKGDEIILDQIEKQLSRGFLNATDIAEHFAKQGIPFREAHGIVGRMVKACENKNCDFTDLTEEDLQQIDSRVTKESLGDISIKTCVDARMSFGGTAPAEVRRQISAGREWLNSLESK